MLTIVFVFGFAWLVEFRPPVVRAAILISIFCYCKWIGRPGFSYNSLALAGLIVLVVNPAYLFSSGAQLSFLAVAAMVLLSSRHGRPTSADPVQRLIDGSRTWRENMAINTWRRVKATCGACTLIWMVTFPLVAYHFHIVAPIALIANPLLMIPIALSLIFGFGVLVFGWLIPPMGQLCGIGCDHSLDLLQTIVECCQQVRFGHFWTSGPTETAVLIFYLGFFLFVAYPPLRLQRWTLGFFFVTWLGIGWAYPSWSSNRAIIADQKLICTFVDVGHGTCVLIQLPGGENVLYDCGSFGSGELGHRAASGTLWHARIEHLDAVIISHADSDHFNALPLILDQFSVDRVVVSDAMYGETEQPLVQKLIQTMDAASVPVYQVSRGDQVPGIKSVDARVLSPPSQGFGGSDNLDSIVLDIQHGQWRILLPGDLERQALNELLTRPTPGYDLVMAPHHGSANSRPEAFMDWSQPSIIVVSGRGLQDTSQIEMMAPKHSYLYHTAQHGAIRIEFGDSEIVARTWRTKPW